MCSRLVLINYLSILGYFSEPWKGEENRDCQSPTLLFPKLVTRMCGSSRYGDPYPPPAYSPFWVEQ